MRNAVKDLLAYGTLSYDDDTAFILIPTDDVTLDNEDPEIVDGGLNHNLWFNDVDVIVTIPLDI